MRKSAIERIVDVEDRSIIDIEDNFGKTYSFNQLALLEIADRLFAILELIDSEPEEIAFEITNVIDSEFELTIVPDDETIDMVFEEYKKLCLED